MINSKSRSLAARNSKNSRRNRRARAAKVLERNKRLKLETLEQRLVFAALFQYDFGSATSPLETGYTRATNADVPGTYTWSGGVNALDRPDTNGTSTNDLTRDFVWQNASNPRTFSHVVDNGTYRVTMLMGDSAAPSQHTISAEGAVVSSTFDGATDEFRYVTQGGAGSLTPATFDVDVTDGVLDLTMGTAGSDQFWVLNSLVIEELVTNSDPVGSVTVTGTTQAGETLTGSNNITDADGIPASGINYQWQRGTTNIAGATSSTYTLTTADVGSTIRLNAFYTDNGGTFEAIASTPVGPVTDVPAGQQPFGGTARAITSTIQAEDFDTGGQGVAYNDANTANNGNAYRPTEGVDIETTTDTGGGFNVGWVAADEWLEYTVNAPAGNYNIEVRAASNSANPGDAQFSLGGQNLGTVAINGTSGWQNWQTFTLDNVSVPAATNGVLRMTAVGGSFNINWFRFVPVTMTTNSDPVGSVTITGTAQEGQTLTGSNNITDADGIPASGINYQWQRGTTNIAGATSSTYTLTTADVGSTIRLNAFYTDNGGTFEAIASTPVGPVTAAPTGSGDVFRYDFGTTTSAVQTGFTRATNANVAGVYSWDTAPNVLERAVSANSNDLTRDFVWHNSTNPRTFSHVVNNGTWRVSMLMGDGSAVSQHSITAEGVLISDAFSAAVDEFRYVTDGGAGSLTPASFEVTVTDGTLDITVGTAGTDQYWVWNSLELEEVVSGGGDSAATGAPAVTGTHQTGQTLTASAGNLADADGIQEIAYRWQRSVGGVATDLGSGYSATNTTYQLVAADQGNEVRVVARVTDNQGNTTFLPSPFVAVNGASNSAPAGSVTISGTTTEGQSLTASNNITDADGLGTISYQWNRGGVAIAGATAATYTLVSADVGATITATASYTDGGGTAESVTSTGVGPVTAATSGGGETFRYDFGTATSPLQTGFTRATNDNVAGVYSWDSAVNALDRGTSAGSNDLTRDFIWQNSSNARTFSHVVTNGTWRVTMLMGDSTAPSEHSITAEGALVSNTFSAANDEFRYVTQGGAGSLTPASFDVVVADGSLDLLLSTAGTDPFWVLNSLELEKLNNNAQSPTTGAPAVTGTPLVGQTLTGTQGTLADANGISAVAYLWQRGVNGTFTDVSSGYSAANANYAVVAADNGNQLRVVARITDNEGDIQFIPSAPVSITAPGAGSTVAVASGNWTSPATWSNGVPGANTEVLIPQNLTVTINTPDAVAETLTVQGTLNVNETPGQDRGLTSRWVHVNSGGLFQVGSAANRFDQADFTLTLTGTDQNADFTVQTATGQIQINNNDAFLMPAGGGSLQFFGQDKLSFTKLAETANANSSQIVVNNVIERNFNYGNNINNINPNSFTTSAANDGSLNWEVGDEIVIASTSLDYRDEEVRTITGITNNGATSTITLNSPLNNRHYGVIESYDGGAKPIDLRAEVALLSRNVKVQGLASQDTDNNFGDRALFNNGNTGNNRGISGHIMVMPTAGAVNFDGVQLDRLGQTGTKGRYPFHWHLGLDRTGDSLRRVSVTNSNNRGVTTHGTNNTLVQDVVLHDIHGHGFFMEDAIERGNEFISNITFGIHAIGVNFTNGGTGYGPRATRNTSDPFIVDTHDDIQQNEARFVNSTGFWIVNPDNTWVGNISAGARGTGFWFALPSQGIGDFANNWQQYTSRPDQTNLRRFDHNTSHSSIIGLNFDRGDDLLQPVGGNLLGPSFGFEWRPPQEPQINYFTGFKHNVGVYHRGRDANFHNNRFADNFNSTFITFTQRLTETLYVGHSRGNAETNRIVTGHTFYDGPNTLDGTHFAGFERSNAHQYRSAFIAARNTHFVMTNTSFETPADRNFSTNVDVQGRVGGYNPLGKGQPSVIWDADGSITSGLPGGGVGRSIVPNNPFYYDNNDTLPSGWNSRISSDTYGTFRIAPSTSQNFTITPPDGTPVSNQTGTTNTFGINAVLKTNPNNTNNNGAGDYRMSFPTYRGGFQIWFTALAGPAGWTMMEFTNQGGNRVTNKPQVGNLNALRNASQTSWARAGSSIWMKFFTHNVGFQAAATATFASALQAATASTADDFATPPPLTDQNVANLFDDATAYWVNRGVDASLFDNVQIVIADLGDNLLGLQGGDKIWLDDDAAGHGWYLDDDTSTDESFSGMDLYTTLAHEMGHVLGLEDLYDEVHLDDLMYGFLEAGERRANVDSYFAEMDA